MTTMAAPKAWISRALRRNSSSPSLREMELTMHLPWAFFNPAKTASQWDESIIRAAFAIDGSLEINLTKRSISAGASSIASSKLMSMTFAPADIWPSAIESASEKAPSEIRRRKRLDPATLVLSPTGVNPPPMETVSSPLTTSLPAGPGRGRGLMPITASATALI